MKTKTSLLLVLCAVALQSARAGALPSELHVRSGYFLSKYTGPIQSNFTSPSTVDLEYSLFVANDRALVFRSTNVLQFPDVQNIYSFAGAGLRFFTNGTAYPVNVEEGGFTYRSNSRWRTYFGFELGLAQAMVQSFGKVLQTNSSLVVGQGNAGAIYALTPSVGVSGQLNLALGFGYSSVAVVSTSVQGLIGLCFFFQ